MTTTSTLSSTQSRDHDLKELVDIYHQTRSMAALNKACEAKIHKENIDRDTPRPDSHAILLMHKVAQLITQVQPHSDVLERYKQWRDSHSRFAHRKEHEGRKRELMEEEDETNAVEHVTIASRSVRERLSKKRMERYAAEELPPRTVNIRREMTVVQTYQSTSAIHEEEVEEGFVSEHEQCTPEMRDLDTFEPVSVEKIRICPDIEFMHGKLGLIVDAITIHVTRFLQLQLQSIGSVRVMTVMDQRKKMAGRLKADLSKGWDCASILKLAVNCHRSLRFCASHLNPLSVFQSALNVRHTTFAHSDPLVLKLEDLLHAAVIGVQIAEVIGAPKMHEFLLRHEIQIISRMTRDQKQQETVAISFSGLQVAERVSSLVPLLPAPRRDHILDTLDALIRRVVSREVSRLSGNRINLEREKTHDLLEFLLSRSEELRVFGPNSNRVQAVVNGLLNSKHPEFSNADQSTDFDGNEMLVLCHQTAECLSLLGCPREYNELNTLERTLSTEMESTLRHHLKLEAPPAAASSPLFVKPVAAPSLPSQGGNSTSDIFRLSDLFHELAKSDTRFSNYRSHVRTACLKRDAYIINLLLYFEQKEDKEALLEDLKQWTSK